MKALFIGRFQPFHNGHLEVIKNNFKIYSEIIIGIGSAQYKDKPENPFSAEERIDMIKKTLENQNIDNFKIVRIPDIHNPPKWVEHVKSIISDFDVVITNNSFTKKLFLEKGYEVKDTDLFNKEKYSGKEIRKRMIKNEKWENLVPDKVVSYIKEIKGIERLKKSIK
jgi:nicotinamide-nucleotide adenylyltransferase